jgi:hypothetical protein
VKSKRNPTISPAIATAAMVATAARYLQDFFEVTPALARIAAEGLIEAMYPEGDPDG